MIFETHAHLNDPAFDEDRESLILGLPQKSIEAVMNVGCCLESTFFCWCVGVGIMGLGFWCNGKK